MSEFTLSSNSGIGRVFETRRMFHWATPASHTPAFRPTRGSGLGGAVDMSADGAGAVLAVEAIEWAHAVSASAVIGRSAHRMAGAAVSRSERSVTNAGPIVDP